MTLPDLLTASARRHGPKIALICGETRVSYDALDQAANRIAAGLEEIGVHEGDGITICGSNSWRWVATYYAVAKLGAVIIPANAKLTPHELAEIMRNSGSKVLCAPHPVLQKFQGSAHAHSLMTFVDIDSSARSTFVTIDDWLSRARAPSPRCVVPEQIAMICYTSGTTGEPRGAMLMHRSLAMNAAMTVQMHARSQSDRVLTALPCSHVYGNTVMNAAIMTGATLILEAKFEAAPFLKRLEAECATILDGVPAHYLSILESSSATQTDFTSLRFCSVGGQSMPLFKMIEFERRIGRPLIELWGMTELGGVGTTHPVLGPNVHGSIGVPLPYTELKIVDLNDPSTAVSQGDVGEIHVRGPTRMVGYYGDEAATRVVIDDDGWLATGDLGRRDSEGRYYIIDRKKDIILSGGLKVYPAEVEAAIAAHPAVHAVAIARVLSPIKGEVPKAYIELREGAISSAVEIIEFCRSHLAPYKLPRQVQFVRRLPRTPSGKIIRRDLEQILSQH